MISVDNFDLRLLAALQDDGRLTNQELAEIAGLSASQCSRRRMRLEEDGVIAGYRAQLASQALGFELIAFIQITLATHSPDNAQKFRALVNRVDEIQEAYALTGDSDYLLKVEPVRHRQQRADAASERGACALLDRARPHQGEREAAAGRAAAQLSAWRKSRELRPPHRGTALRHCAGQTISETTMALQLRPNCESCDKDLPPAATDARICSYECTFCADCVETRLFNVCPNCGGGFAPRPIRPAHEWRPGACVTKQLPSDKRVHLKYAAEDVAAFVARVKDVAPDSR